MAKKFLLSFLACLLISTVLLGIDHAVADTVCDSAAAGTSGCFFSRGVHNEYLCDSGSIDCSPSRNATDPQDPEYSDWWISDWTMYRIFQNYEDNPPPYNNPPEGLAPDDYEVSYGTTYYDATYIPDDGDGIGAMREDYLERCLPLFPTGNEYSCSYISLGNKAYFLKYEDESLNVTTANICLFSPGNHPPERDFIQHLPYSPEDSERLNDSVLAYRDEAIDDAEDLFGYAFNKQTEEDGYQYPQSFYFSGNRDPNNGTYAPIISQHYSNFRVEKPELQIWSEIEQKVKTSSSAGDLCQLPDSKSVSHGYSQSLIK